MEKIYYGVIEFLPTNCQFVVGKLDDEEIKMIFIALSRSHYDHFSLYIHLLPYVYEKCDYNVLQFIEVLMKTINDNNKRKKFQEFKSSKKYHRVDMYSNIFVCYICVI